MLKVFYKEKAQSEKLLSAKVILLSVRVAAALEKNAIRAARYNSPDAK